MAMCRKMDEINSPGYLHMVSHNELLDTPYVGKQAIIDDLLYTGAYILAGAPKIGKSFLVAQIAYHVSTGQPLWGYNARQGDVLYLALEDDEKRLQDRMYRMFGVNGTDLQLLQSKLETGWMNSWNLRSANIREPNSSS